MIKVIIYMILMPVVYNLFMRNSKKHSNRTGEEDDYTIRISYGLVSIGKVAFYAGMIGALILIGVHIRNHAFSMAYAYLALSFGSIGLLIILSYLRWKVVVRGDDIVFYPLFGRKKQIKFSELDKAKEGNPMEMLVLKKNKKTVMMLDRTSDNYEKFHNSLKKYDVLIKDIDYYEEYNLK